MTAVPLRDQGPRAIGWRGLVFAVAVPFLFLHDKYQPHLVVHAGGGVTFRIADVALGVIAVAAIWAVRSESVRFNVGRAVWITGSALVAVTAAACFYPRAYDPAYPVVQSFVSVVKYWEYAILAPAAVVLLRRRRDIEALVAALVVWSVAMTAVGTLQFLGVINELSGRRPGQREPSYVGILDFAALSVASLSVGFVIVAFGARGRERVVGAIAVVVGALGLVLAGSVAGVLAAAGCAATIAAAAVLRRRLRAGAAAIITVTLVAVALGVVALRGSDLARFAAFLGIKPQSEVGAANIQTYSQRTILLYVGYRMWLQHPVIGSGFLASAHDPAAYMPVVPAARRRFPNVDPAAFPSPTNRWGVQDVYVQALADMGLVGFAALVAFLAAVAVAAARAFARAGPELAPVAALGAAWFVATAILFVAQGIIAGIPLDALLWLGIGLALTARSLGAQRAAT